MPSKICSKCKEEKDISRFSPSKGCLFGVHSICKVCKCSNKEKALEKEAYLNSVRGRTKLCLTCDKIKSLSEFTRDRLKKDGHNNTCKNCKKDRSVEDRVRHYGKSYTEKLSGSIQTCSLCNGEFDVSNFCKKRGDKFYLMKKCKKCRGDLFSKRNIKNKLILEKGQYCILCGYDGILNPAAIDFHHVSPSEKDSNVSRFSNIELAREEVSKCVLLCANCHRGLHSGVFFLPNT